MSEATTNTLKTFQDLVKQLDSRPSDPQSEPFKIEEYAAAAEQIKKAAEQLSTLLEAFNQTISPERLDLVSARMSTLTQQAETSSKKIVDYAFKKLIMLGLILVSACCVIVLVTSLVFWMLKKKFAQS